MTKGPSDAREIALTFDDGPNPPYTDRILDVLREEHVPATFFVVGRAAVAYPGTLRRIAREGHAIGNHTWGHEHLIVLTPAQLRASLRRTDGAIFSATGEHTHLMRPLYGAPDWLVLDVVQHLGYTPLLWLVPLPRDWESPSASVLAHRVLPYVRDGSTLDFHA